MKTTEKKGRERNFINKFDILPFPSPPPPPPPPLYVIVFYVLNKEVYIDKILVEIKGDRQNIKILRNRGDRQKLKDTHILVVRKSDVL